MSTVPYSAETIALGHTRAGQARALSPMTATAAATLAPAIAAIGPWAHYQMSAGQLEKSLSGGPGAISYQLTCGGDLAGAVLIRSPWLVGPYLQMLAILPVYQGGGTGAAILEWYEASARAAKLRQVWLCVTGVNGDAQRFYLRQGYEHAGVLADLLRDGDAELLMRKRV